MDGSILNEFGFCILVILCFWTLCSGNLSLFQCCVKSSCTEAPEEEANFCPFTERKLVHCEPEQNSCSLFVSQLLVLSLNLAAKTYVTVYLEYFYI